VADKTADPGGNHPAMASWFSNTQRHFNKIEQ
jgi:hypothetical protein